LLWNEVFAPVAKVRFAEPNHVTQSRTAPVASLVWLNRNSLECMMALECRAMHPSHPAPV
jgi:hypothetical protein